MAANRFVMILLVAAASVALVAARPQEDKQAEINKEEKQGEISNEIPLDTEINTTAVPTSDASPDNTTAAPAPPTAAPPRSTIFSKIWDDIFEIPKMVLNAVNKLMNSLSRSRLAHSS